MPAPAGPMSSTASVVPAGSGAAAAGGAVGMATGPPGGSGTWPVVSGAGGAQAGAGPGGGAGYPGAGGGGGTGTEPWCAPAFGGTGCCAAGDQPVAGPCPG
ncbi:hypothetical protein GCM10010103_50150 [Streptomyces paradoxus]